MKASASINKNKHLVPFSPPDISQLEIEEVVDTLRSGWITTGPKTKLFERKIANFCNTSKSACLNSATASMELTLRLLGVRQGDEVITTAYTYTASASVIEHVGAKIVLVDTAKDSFQMDYDQLEDAITEKTKVIIPVDLAGVMCDYDRIFDVVQKKSVLFQPLNSLQAAFGRVVVLTDAAHSFGANRKGQHSGEVADFTCFSFHAVKNLTTGEGGAVTWRDIPGFDNEEIYKQFMLLSLHGQSKDALAKTKNGAWEYDIMAPNYKSNMTDIAASIGLAQIERYPEILQRRRQIIEEYSNRLASDRVQPLQHFGPDFTSSGHLYILRILGKGEQYRNSFIQKMAERGVSTNVHYKPLPMHSGYKNLGFDIKDYPNAFHMYQNQITLPLHTLLTDKDVEHVCKSFLEVMKEME